MTGNLRAHGGNIDVWLAFYHEIADAHLHKEYRELLTPQERSQELRFYFADDRRRYLVTRALVRTVLSRYFEVAPADWRFSANPYGRPMIANVAHQQCGLCFNISHARGLIALAVARHREVGVDVENVSTREVSLAIADRFFSASEVAELTCVPRERQQDRFFEYWTFKESYIKARGMGLSIPLQLFSFHYPHERAVRIDIHPKLGDDASRWSFWQFRPTDAHLMALCVERRGSGVPTVTIRKVIPMRTDERLELPVLKASHHFDPPAVSGHSN